ncbi:hypothetical protein C1Y08_16120 [Pseudomonas sp. FW306-02-F02-AA]|uniref:Uncharacterized protein n=1 Tax=Pseudomonas fluorescens TaxID=294 RepID=A0A0N9WCF9_PSEFL|nr:MULTISPECIES: hypothetical protein [Pseudomonas]ALI01905.1 hypothetical protein AO353_12730 [Pseudomonas fluorescens]PMZ05384.1 hypothetical protein C1Y07_05430 [Pseudomonas sp. FW306-02-F02-AB]PMZ09289.1 hypothetical protein C1Y06_15370 [Pseudomonas sp. FW306-02-H06C]PMZ15001.1 hypothetical protein C1Y08_16120 [Pseudomonas sp. FW306-02-F02-AA]PMZ20188.1 hypothetical protein C1Y09_20355 [Pseudomonas sp. FW306-02-F08-AA]
MFNFDKALDLPPQLQWKYADEPELLGWTIRARNYNTFVANCMFAFMSIVIMGGTYAVYSVAPPGESYLSRISASVVFYLSMSFTISCMTHQRMNFAYRFTQSGVECCEWKDFPKWALTFLKWLAGITAIIFVFLATIDPAFLIGALIGPGGIGLMYLSMANSRSYQKMQTQYHHLTYEWKDFTQLAIATNRDVVDLKYTMYDNGIVTWSQNIFCKRKQKENVAKLIEPYLSPGVPFIKAKVNVPLSTD